MDWNLEKKRKEKMKASNSSEGDKSIDLMLAMEREFTRVFGAELPRNKGKAGDYVGRSDLTKERKFINGNY